MLPSINTTAKIQDLQTKFLQDGKQVTTLRLSVGEKNKKGEYDNFNFTATFWEATAKFVSDYFKTGDHIQVKGDLITTNYTNNAGVKVYSTEMRFPRAGFVPKNKDEASAAGMQATQQAPQTATPAPAPVIDVNEDDIPFSLLLIAPTLSYAAYLEWYNMLI